TEVKTIIRATARFFRSLERTIKNVAQVIRLLPLTPIDCSIRLQTNKLYACAAHPTAKVGNSIEIILVAKDVDRGTLNEITDEGTVTLTRSLGESNKSGLLFGTICFRKYFSFVRTAQQFGYWDEPYRLCQSDDFICAVEHV